MSTTTCTSVLAEDPVERAEAMAVGGFLAGYAGATRTSYATDLRIFASWCRQADLGVLTVRRSHLELFGRWMEETGRMRSTVARRLSTLANFYRYCEQEQLIDRMVKRLARRAGITKRISPHSLRHSFITAALDAGVPLRDVQEAASHADPRTTMRYDRGRGSLDRHATYIVAMFLAGASR